MTEPRPTMAGAGRALLRLARSLILLGAIAVAIPWALVLASRTRFGGGAPWHGVPPPGDRSFSRIQRALTERLTDQTVGDILIRCALLVAWVAVIVIVVTVLAEVVHMLRHDGLPMPDVRWFGPPQATARLIAAGLLVVVPLFTSPSGAIARPGSSPSAPRSVAAALGSSRSTSPGPPNAWWPSSASSASPDVARPAEVRPSPDAIDRQYVVRSGDSIFGIAERLVGPEPTRVAAFAERLVDLNLGRRMPDGRRFDNAAFIDVGWLLELPDVPNADEGGAIGVPPSAVHVVEAGETLWSIAEDELGDPARWPEVYDANDGRIFDDGGRLRDPDVILPGWELALPVVDPEQPGVDGSAAAPVADTDPAVDRFTIDHPAVDGRGVDGSGVGSADLDPDSRLRPDVAADDRPGPADPIPSVDVAAVVTPVAHRTNIWDEAGRPGDTAADDAALDDTGSAGAADDDASGAELLTMGAAAMLSAGVLTLLAVRRSDRLRRARARTVLPKPGTRAVMTERLLRSIDVGDRFARVEAAVRAVATVLIEHGCRVEVVRVASDGELELRATGPVELPSPWIGGGSVWSLASSTPLELLLGAARPISPPCPTLVQLGIDDEHRDVYVDLEGIGAIEIGGPGAHADSVVAAIAATLAGSLLAEITTLVGVGVPDEAFLGHRRYVPAQDGRGAFEAAAAAIGSTASLPTSTFELRALGIATDTWEPAVVLAGAAVGALRPPRNMNGLAVVSAAPIHGPSSRLAPDGDSWVLRPAGIRLIPVGVTPADIGAVAELVTMAVPVEDDPVEDGPVWPTAAASGVVDLDVDETLVPMPNGTVTRLEAATATYRGSDDDERPASGAAGDGGQAHVVHSGEVASASPPYELLVRMIGPVDVVDRVGGSASFERSKTRELVAWLVTHRDRSTRSSARTAMWELDVRDATFANVVSEARRALARLVPPPEGDEWVGRTMTDALPVHELVLSDAEVIRWALDVARVQPPAQAVATLSPAVELIAGVPFEGTSYLWPDSEGITSDLVLLATSASTELASHCLAMGDIAGVFSATGRGLRVLPGHEELIAFRMEAHARAGDHAGVRQEWESYERVINGDPWSDGEPAPKLIELRHRLLNPSR